MGKVIIGETKRAAAPKKWKYFYDMIAKMRAKKDAPVDTMGCHMLAAEGSTPKEQRFHILVSLMLSSQTKDQITASAMARLHQLPLTVEKIIETDISHLSDLIYPVSFYRRKAETLRKSAMILKEQYESDVPKTIDELTALPGIGPKMAYLALQNAWDLNIGIGVDVHVHRICNRLGWVKSKTPEETRLALQDWLPREHWRDINPLLVGFGQTMCLPMRPRCSDCLLRNGCPASTAKERGQKMIKESFDSQDLNM